MTGAQIGIDVVVYVIVVAGLWRVFEKAHEDGWKAIVPIWNVWILLKIVGRPQWWTAIFVIPYLFLLFVPLVTLISFVLWIIVANDLSKSFGRGAGTTVGLIFLAFIFVPILGFGDAEYKGPAAAPAGDTV